jgi:hypothetical protein
MSMNRKEVIVIFLMACISYLSAQQADSAVIPQAKESSEMVIDTNKHQKVKAHAPSVDSTVILQAEESFMDTNGRQKVKVHSPKKAGWMSAALPGLGQGYNKKYWKIPIIYAGFAGSGIGIYYFYSQYKIYRDEYRNRLNEAKDLLNPDLAYMQNSNLNATKQMYQRDMEIFIIVSVVWYFLNILDAVVDAHLMSFDVSEDLSFYVAPSIGYHRQLTSVGQSPFTALFTFTLNF